MPKASSTAASFHHLLADEWEYSLREYPVWASSIGEMRYADRWGDVSLGAYRAREMHDREVRGRIARIRRSDLSPEDQLSYDLFLHRVDDAVEGAQYRLHLLALDQRGGIQTADDVADALPFEKEEHFRQWNERLRAFGTYMDQTIELLAEGARTKMTHPRVVMNRVLPQIDKQIHDDPTKSPFFAPYTRKNAPAALAEEAKRHIAAVVVPAFRKMRTFFESTYLPACSTDVGAWSRPNGEAMYAYLVRSHTTTKMMPDEVHALGLREVARIRGEMNAVMKRTGFHGSLREFFDFLRNDPRFFFKDGASLLTAYRELSKRVDPLLAKVFRRLPRAPYGVQAIPDTAAPDTTTAYYREPAADGSRAGTYFVNLYKPEARPKWEMVALTLHEAVPGHHLQIALAMEQENLPRFRRHADYTAYIEGWALYAESLGEELGLYADPYDKFGQLAYEMWRAVRLVVDTGVHQLKWDRQRAIDFFMENAPKAELDVVNEVDRYIAWPGQALAYKVGELEIKKLRRQKETALGAKFDLKAFHDRVLEAGALPLDILERRVLEN